MSASYFKGLLKLICACVHVCVGMQKRETERQRQGEKQTMRMKDMQ